MFEAEARWLRRALDAFPAERLSPAFEPRQQLGRGA